MLAKLSDNEIMEVANPLMDHLMQASQDIDFEAHVRDFTPRLKGAIHKDGFERMCREFQQHYGNYKERTLKGIFRRESSVAVVWSQACEKSQDELVASMVIVEDGSGKRFVDHAPVY